ncbi:MAG: AI-2E family transporter [Limisphaerales bacterium]
MSFPPPTERQARILWQSLTALAIGILLALAGLLCWGLAWVLARLSSVLLPLAIAGILAYLLDPVVGFFERHKVPRTRAILLVFLLGIMLVLLAMATVVPKLIVETNDLINDLPANTEQLQARFSVWLAKSAWGTKAKQVWDYQLAETAHAWLTKVLPEVSRWALAQMGRVASWAGLLAGLALVPIYVFYFLFEKQGIAQRWTDYLPFRESRVKDEVVFVLRAINDCLIVFFRGQILVALCDGILLTIGFLLVGVPYAFLLGMVAGLLSIVPYLGVMVSVAPAVALAAVQFNDWKHPALVLLVFAIVQTAEGLLISPKIMGDRVGLHPLTIIVAVMIGTTLLGGILGGVLAIPLTAALRVLMFRYVWKPR